MPPSSSVVASGSRTAQRTNRNSATIGIFKKTISQMKVQVVTSRDRTTRDSREVTASTTMIRVMVSRAA